MLNRSEVAYIYLHDAKPGCYAARVDRESLMVIKLRIVNLMTSQVHYSAISIHQASSTALANNLRLPALIEPPLHRLLSRLDGHQVSKQHPVWLQML
jgi:hypothetical protein